jgi:hypothetical protein
MNKELIADVLDKVRSWPEQDQEELVEVAREIEARRIGVYVMTEDERRAVEAAKAGPFASEDEVAAFWKRHNIP